MNKDRIYLSPPHMGGQELDFVHQAFESNFIAPVGPQLDEFERRFCDLTNFKYCLPVSSCTAAIHLALRLLDVGTEDVVIASTLTFIGSVVPATFVGAQLHFVDSDRATWNMDPALLKEAINVVHAKGKKVGAVVPTDIYGQCADYDTLRKICERHDIPLVIDAAESVGAYYKGKHAGFGGDAAVYSFNGNKIVTTGGGGVLASNDKEFISKASHLSQQARDDAPHYEHTTTGYNYRMSNVAAAIGLGQLAVLPSRVARCREIFQYYADAMSGKPVSFMPEAQHGKANRWLTVMLLDEKLDCTPEDIRLALEAENIESRPVWKPMHMQPVFNGTARTGGDVSADIFRRGLCLPSGTAMTDQDLERVVNVMRSVLS